VFSLDSACPSPFVLCLLLRPPRFAGSGLDWTSFTSSPDYFMGLSFVWFGCPIGGSLRISPFPSTAVAFYMPVMQLRKPLLECGCECFNCLSSFDSIHFNSRIFPSSSSALSTGAIVGIVIGGVPAVCLIFVCLALGLWLYSHRRLALPQLL